MTVRIIVGLTRTDRLNNYIPMMDGYRDGAEQDAIAITIDGLTLTELQWAEAVFVATNAPADALSDYDGALAVRAALGLTRALSVGDTVTVDGTRYVCERLGWTRQVA